MKENLYDYVVLDCKISKFGPNSTCKDTFLFLTKRCFMVLFLCLNACLLANAQVEDAVIYGSVINAQDGDCGIYSFTPKDAKLTPVKMATELKAQGGGVYAQGKYYSIHADTRTLHIYDTDTWELLESKPIANLTLDMTFDPTTQDIYGCFIDQGAVLGKLHPSDGTYERVNKLDVILTTLFCTNEGQLYGIANNGGLYTINKATAEVTFVGETGLFPMFAQSATIDPNTGKCYWAAMFPDFTSGLYEVNLSTGEASQFYSFPNGEEITGLYILRNIPADAPAAVENFEVNFTSGSNDGTVSFKMPSKKKNGTPLTGQLDYKLYLNNEMQSGKTSAGETISKSVHVETGMCKFVVVASNEAGDGEQSVKSMWIGADSPETVSGLTLKKTSKTSIALSWNAPTKGTHGGYVNPDAITYKIVRYPEGVTVQEGQKQLSFIEEITKPEQSKYWYGVVVSCNDLESEEVLSNKVTMGDGKEIPYYESFDNAAQVELLTVIDANNDGHSWYHSVENGVEQVDATNKCDDWLVTQPVRLSKESYYKVSFKSVCNSNDTHCIGISIGKLPNVEDLTQVVMEPINIATGFEQQSFSAKFRIADDDDYYLGFHATSNPAYPLSFDDIVVEQLTVVDAPATVSDIAIVPAKKGALNAKITFHAPKKTIAGETLQDISKVELYRNGNLIYEFSEVTPGQEMNFTDNEPVNGFNEYMFIAYNGKGRGDDINKKAYIGVDVPVGAMNVNAQEITDGVVTITWEAPTKGLHGGYIDSNQLKYFVRRNGSFLVGNGALTELSVTDTIEGLGDKQYIYGYSINAYSEAGMGEDAFSPCVMVGKPYELPIVESFSNGSLTYTDWTTFPMLSGSKWDPVMDNNDRAQDGDHGMLSLISPMGPVVQPTLMSPKFRMDNAVKPVLEFWVYHSSNEGGMILELLNPEQQFKNVLNINFGQNIGEWKKYTVDLSEYVNERTLQFIFTTLDFKKGDVIYIDNVNVYDDLDHNLAAVSLDAPRKLEVGKTGDFIVSVSNLGKQTANNYTINLYNGDEMKGSVSGPSLSAGETKNVSIKTMPQTTDLYEMKLHAVVQYEADENLNNNTTNVVAVKVIPLPYPVITDLKGNKEETCVNLTWTAPDLTNLKPKSAIEDFEDYEAFTVTELGDWTMIDKDNNEYSMEFRTSDNQWILYPNSGGKMSFQVIDLTQTIGTKKDGWTSVSGNKILISPYSGGANGGNDDWLISPELYSLGQTITLNAKSLNYENYGLEHFQVLYSTTDKNSDSFVELATEENVPMEWTEYSYTLPQNAKYFAIRAYGVNSALFLDDITFIPVSSKPVELDIIGYNVYRNGKKLNDNPIAETSYVDNDISDNDTYRYQITVTYDKGESDYSNEYIASPLNGITGTDTDASVLFTEHGSIRIDNTSGETVEVYTANGTLVVREKNKKTLSVNVPRGIYIVKIGSEASKVVVR